jgi:hypothetical protein
LWIGDTLVYDDAGGVRLLGADGRSRGVLPGLRAPVLVAGAAALLALRPDGTPTVLAPPAFGEVR